MIGGVIAGVCTTAIGYVTGRWLGERRSVELLELAHAQLDAAHRMEIASSRQLEDAQRMLEQAQELVANHDHAPERACVPALTPEEHG